MRVRGSDIVHWAETRYDCRTELPALVGRLVRATTNGLLHCDFPSGEGVQKPGADGRVNASEATPFVPVGCSVWEIGTDVDIRRKATEEYEKRHAVPPAGIDPASTTFVFVTPRRWGAREQWAAEKRTTGAWRDVRVFDADNLEQWLESAPGVEAWLASLLGLPQDAWTLDQAWREWSLGTTPPLTEELAFAGRSKAEEEIVTWLGKQAEVKWVTLDDPDEAVAYLRVVLRRRPEPQRSALLERALVVDSDETLRRVAAAGSHMVIVARECSLEVARLAAARGHHVIVASTKDGDRQTQLGPFDPGAVAATLVNMGLSPVEAGQKSTSAGGSLTRLRELLGATPAELDPTLAPLVLVGSWEEDRVGDVERVARLLGPSRDLNELLRRYSGMPGAPLMRVGKVVRWTSQAAAWRSLAKRLTKADLEAFRKLAIEVLTTVDPKYELPEDQQFAAVLYGKVPAHSSELARGLAEGVLHLGAGLEGDAQRPEHRSIAEWIVRAVMQALTSKEAWRTADHLLSAFAEAAPGTFLDELRGHLEERRDLLRDVLRGTDGMFGPTTVTGLVRALELLAWAPAHLPMVTRVLLELAEIDPGGNVSPRPSSAIEDIYCPWYPRTCATLHERLAILQRISEHQPTRALWLCERLFSKHSTMGGGSRPVLRPWAAAWREGVTHAELVETNRGLAESAVRTVNREPRLWVEVLGLLPMLSEEYRDRLFAVLPSLFTVDLTPAEAAKYRAALRRFLRRPPLHRTEEPAATEVQLGEVRRLLAELEPEDLRERWRWLFDSAPALPDFEGDDWVAENERIAERRRAVAAELARALDTRSLIEFAGTVAEPGWFGYSLARDPGQRELALAMVRGSLPETADWARKLWHGLLTPLVEADGLAGSEAWVLALPPRQRAEAALTREAGPDVWDAVERWGAEASDHYWSMVDPRFVSAPDVARATESLLAHGRPLMALWMLGMRLWDKEVWVSVELLENCLRAAAAADPEREVGVDWDGRHVTTILKRMEEAGANEEVLANLEWLWLLVIERQQEPRHLLVALEKQPEIFVEMLCRIYRREGDAEGERRDERAALNARLAWRLLNAWRRMPGARPEGTVDADALGAWVEQVRALASQRGRRESADELVGQILARAPQGADGHWPHEAVRDLLEFLSNRDIEHGFVIGRLNSRGMTSRAPLEGGAQERALAAAYRGAGGALRTRWPTTASLLVRLAEDYEREGQGADHRAAERAASQRHDAYAGDRLAELVDRLQMRGRYTFSAKEATAEARLDRYELAHEAEALVKRTRVAKVEDDFFVIVPLEHRSAGAPPPTWYVDDWMRHVGTSYYVGLRTAASMHGAGDQEGSAFQVMVPEPREPAIVGTARIEFVADSAVHERAEPSRNTPTGSVRVSSPERTLFDLVTHAAAVGGLSVIAEVVQALGGGLDPRVLAELSDDYPMGVRQRVGWLLDHAGHGERTRALLARVRSDEPSVVTLRDGARGTVGTDNTWNVEVGDAFDPSS